MEVAESTMINGSGRLGVANREIRDAIESLNLTEVRHTPAPLRSALTALVAALPFEYAPRIGPRPSPTAAIEVVFDIQDGIFHLMDGTEPAGQSIDVAS